MYLGTLGFGFYRNYKMNLIPANKRMLAGLIVGGTSLFYFGLCCYFYSLAEIISESITLGEYNNLRGIANQYFKHLY